ncbi:MAG TPA: RNA polymerase sigma factor [Candidatus Koribacter sp.]|jgi:RNA polymerase sigma-70 factor (ECF subfamily)
MDFEQLANQHKDSVYRQMIRVCGNHADAEDVLIEALLKAYRHLDQLRDSIAFRSWLATIAQRVCWQLKQQQALAPLLQLSMLDDEGQQLPSRETPPDTRAALQQMKSIVAAAIAALPPRDREVYQLRDLEQLPGDEVARRLKISLSAMKSRLHRARSQLRERIDQALAGQ